MSEWETNPLNHASASKTKKNRPEMMGGYRGKICFVNVLFKCKYVNNDTLIKIKILFNFSSDVHSIHNAVIASKRRKRRLRRNLISLNTFKRWKVERWMEDFKWKCVTSYYISSKTCNLIPKFSGFFFFFFVFLWTSHNPFCHGKSWFCSVISLTLYFFS